MNLHAWVRLARAAGSPAHLEIAERELVVGPICANSQRRRSCAHPAGCFQSPVYTQWSVGRKTTRPTPTGRQLVKNSRHLTEETETSALNNS